MIQAQSPQPLLICEIYYHTSRVRPTALLIWKPVKQAQPLCLLRNPSPYLSHKHGHPSPAAYLQRL